MKKMKKTLLRRKRKFSKNLSLILLRLLPYRVSQHGRKSLMQRINLKKWRRKRLKSKLQVSNGF